MWCYVENYQKILRLCFGTTPRKIKKFFSFLIGVGAPTFETYLWRPKCPDFLALFIRYVRLLRLKKSNIEILSSLQKRISLLGFFFFHLLLMLCSLQMMYWNETLQLQLKVHYALLNQTWQLSQLNISFIPGELFSFFTV